MSFVVNPGTVQTPLTSGGVAYGTGSSVKVSGAGTAGQVLTSNGSSVPTWATLAAGVQSFTSSGSITAGNSVVLNADGTVSTATGSIGAYAVGSPTSFRSGGAGALSLLWSAYDPVKNVVAVVYGDPNSGYWPTVVIGTISSGVVTWGTPVVIAGVDTSGSSIYVAYNAAAGAFVCSYGQPNSIYVSAFTTAGTVPTIGSTLTLWTSGTAWNLGINYHTSASGVLVWWTFGGSQLRATYITTSGTTCTKVTETIASGLPGSITNYGGYNTGGAPIYDPAGSRTAFFFICANTINYVVASISGSTLTLSTDVDTGTPIGTVSRNPINAAYDTTNARIVLCYAGSQSGYGKGTAVVCSISGTTVTFNTPVDFYTLPTPLGSNSLGGCNVVYDQTTGKTLIAYSDYYTGYLYYVVATTTSTSISFGSPTTLVSGDLNSLYCNPFIYCSGLGGDVLAYGRTNPSSVTRTFIAPITTNFTNWIGVAAQSVSTGQPVNVTVLSGINTNQSGLTVNTTYYCDQFGNLTTSATGNIKVGRAVAATKIYITNGNG